MVYKQGDEQVFDGRNLNSIQTRVHWIDADKINAVDKRFQVSTETNVENLTLSIQKVGLIHPLLLTARSQEYIIVSGFRRMAACQQLDWHRIPAIILDSQEGIQDCVELAIADNSLQRPLNLVEISRALGLLAGQQTADSHLAAAAANLGLPDNPRMINKLIKISGLPGQIQTGVLDNTISLAMALELGQLEADIGIAVVALFNKLKVGLNRQRELLLLIKEIAKRENISIAGVLQADEFDAIVNAEDQDRSIKNRQLRAYLRRRRYPMITRAEENFKIHLKQLNLGRGIRLMPPKEFEGNTYQLSLDFESLSELADLRSKVDQLVENTSLKKILERTV